jgi:hypothetical protein
MRFDLENLPADLSMLQALVRDLAATLEADRGRLDEATGEIERLRTIIRHLQRVRFGRSSERLDADQLVIELEDLDADVARIEESLPAADVEPPRTSVEAKDSRRLPENLARSEIVINVETGVCPCCGGTLHLIGETVSEMLDWVPASLRVLRVRRPKYACRSCGTAHQAAAPERAIAKGLADAEACRASADRQILRSSTALSTGADLRPVWSKIAAIDALELGRRRLLVARSAA